MHRGLWPEAALALICAAAFLAALLFPLAALATPYTPEERTLLDAYASGQIIRLHVLADGDDPESQRIKLCVRDALIEAFGATLCSRPRRTTPTRYTRRFWITSRSWRPWRRSAPGPTALEGSVTAEVGVMTLPQKAYGHVVLPEGSYRALRVTLGNGAGRNWVVRALSPALPGRLLRQRRGDALRHARSHLGREAHLLKLADFSPLTRVCAQNML